MLPPPNLRVTRHRQFFLGRGVAFLAILTAALLVSSTGLAGDSAPASRQPANGWIQLFDGKSLFGWTPVGGAQWKVENGAITAQSGANGYLRSNTVFSDFILRCDFRVTGGGASGIYLRTDTKGDPSSSGYKLQINNQDAHFPTGSLVSFLKAAPVKAATGAWHTFVIQAQGSHFHITLDGAQTVEGKAKKSKAGALALGFVAGSPIEFRNIWLKPLGLQPIFNGQNLFGWKVVNPPGAKQKKRGKFSFLFGGGGPDWLVKDGAIHVKKGPSELESGSLYDDFVLQLTIRANGNAHHTQGGVLLRGERGVFSTGYRVQIDNEFSGKNRAKPVNYGTGGLFGIEPARWIASENDRYFYETIVIRGHHISVWVDGLPVCDFEDSRPAGADALIESRNGAGTIGLLSTNKDSSLDFKDIRVADLPKAVLPPTKPAPGIAPAAPAPSSLPAAAVAAPSSAPIRVLANPHQKEIAQLTEQALASNDPAQQVDLYNQILALDPSNLVAYNGRKDAQAKLDALEAQQAEQAEQAEKAQSEAQTNQVKKQQALAEAESALLAGNLVAARSNLDIAKAIDPTDPEVKRLEPLIARQERDRRLELYGAIALGVLILAGVVLLLFWRRGAKEAYLEVVDGSEKGKRYLLNQEVIHLGAVAEDGGTKNEVVIPDPQHTVSRFHCEIHQRKGKFYVLDCGSANGTFLDGHRLHARQPVILKKRARLRVASACSLRLAFARKKKT